jgi:hypothetical protein
MLELEKRLSKLCEIDPQYAMRAPRVPAVDWSTDRRQLTLSHRDVSETLWELLRDQHHLMLQRAELMSTNLFGGTWKLEWLALQEKPDDIISGQEVLRFILQNAADTRGGRARRTIPCPRQFHAMALSPGSESTLLYRYAVQSRLSPRAIFPFCVDSDEKLSLSGIENLIQRTYANRMEKATSERDVARAVLDLVQTADAWLREELAERVDYSVEELRRCLGKKYGSDILLVLQPYFVIPDLQSQKTAGRSGRYA